MHLLEATICLQSAGSAYDEQQNFQEKNQQKHHYYCNAISYGIYCFYFTVQLSDICDHL